MVDLVVKPQLGCLLSSNCVYFLRKLTSKFMRTVLKIDLRWFRLKSQLAWKLGQRQVFCWFHPRANRHAFVCQMFDSYTLIVIWATTRQNPTKWVCGQRRLRSAWASTQSDAQTDPSLRWPHTHFVGFCHVAAHIILTGQCVTATTLIPTRFCHLLLVVVINWFLMVWECAYFMICFSVDQRTCSWNEGITRSDHCWKS